MFTKGMLRRLKALEEHDADAWRALAALTERLERLEKKVGDIQNIYGRRLDMHVDRLERLEDTVRKIEEWGFSVNTWTKKDVMSFTDIESSEPFPALKEIVERLERLENKFKPPKDGEVVTIRGRVPFESFGTEPDEEEDKDHFPDTIREHQELLGPGGGR